jgi:FKBP-type peptidyl-prolyl cis-trans isomerase
VLRRSVLALSLAVVVSACGGGGDDNPNTPTPPPPQGPAGLVVEDITVGTGTEGVAGKLFDVNYNLYSYEPSGSGGRGVLLQSGPFSFRQGTNSAIPGFDQGVVGMRVGGVRRLTIPPSLGYGASPPANSGIQANAWLVFDIQLTNVRD